MNKNFIIFCSKIAWKMRYGVADLTPFSGLCIFAHILRIFLCIFLPLSAHIPFAFPPFNAPKLFDDFFFIIKKFLQKQIPTVSFKFCVVFLIFFVVSVFCLSQKKSVFFAGGYSPWVEVKYGESGNHKVILPWQNDRYYPPTHIASPHPILGLHLLPGYQGLEFRPR